MNNLICFIQIMVFLVCINGCEKSVNTLPLNNTASSPILFAHYYINYAWGYQYSGWYVDNAGQIYETDKNAALKLVDINRDTLFSENLMIDLLQASSKTNRKIDAQILSGMKKLIVPASQGQLSKGVDACRDFGVSLYFTFNKYSNENGYKEILLVQFGDWVQKNQAPEASELFMLLREYVDGDTTRLPCYP